MTSLPSSGFDAAQLPDASHRTENQHVAGQQRCPGIHQLLASCRHSVVRSGEHRLLHRRHQRAGDRQSRAWFILGVMLFSYAVRSVYVESCTMFTRGGFTRSCAGPRRNLAKLAVSALMFDYVLTGPITAVSAGQYMVGLSRRLLTCCLPIWGHHCDPTSTAHKAMGNIFTVVPRDRHHALLLAAQYQGHPRIQRPAPFASCSLRRSWECSSSAGAC